MEADQLVDKACKRLIKWLNDNHIPNSNYTEMDDEVDAAMDITHNIHISIGFYNGILYSVGIQKGESFIFKEFKRLDSDLENYLKLKIKQNAK